MRRFHHHHRHRYHQWTGLLWLVGATLLLSCGPGCLVSSNTTSHQSGNYVSDATFAQVEPGKTTAAWVKATMGPPTSIAHVNDMEIWRYTYTQHQDSSGAVFLVFGGHSETQTDHTAFVQIKDGVVVKAWRS
jgi:outer membrane protein assembly factor BamE (lipoprotein component of BamABCDE complex)